MEVRGELRLYDPNLEINYQNLQSSYTLKHQLNEMKTELEDNKENESQIMQIIDQEIDKIKITYLPILQVDSIKRQSDARGIIFEKLKYRVLQKRRDELMRSTS